MSCGYNNPAVNLQQSTPTAKPTAKPATKPATAPPLNLRVGMNMLDADNQFPDENNQGLGKPPPIRDNFTVSMIMNARMAERSRREHGGSIDVQEDERACRNVPVGNTNVMQQECAKLSNRSVPNPLLDRLMSVQSRYME